MRSNYRVVSRMDQLRMRAIYSCWIGSLYLGDVVVDSFDDQPSGLRYGLEAAATEKVRAFIQAKNEMFAQYDEQLKWSD